MVDLYTIDVILRLILIAFFATFLLQSLMNYKKARDKGETQATRFFLAYSLFFLITLANFIHSEIQFQYINAYGVSMYDPAELPIQIGTMQFNADIHTIIFIGYLIPSLIPIVYIVEKELLKFKFQILTILGIGLSITFIIVLLIPSIISILFIPAGLGLLALCFCFISIYIKLIIVSDGIVKKSAIFSLFGWISLIVGFIFVGLIMSFLGFMDTTEVGTIQHIIGIIGVILIFWGSRILKH